MEARVYHRLYTHAADVPGSTGGHMVGLADLDIDRHLPRTVVESVDQLLPSLVSNAASPGYAVRRFAAHGGSIVCLAVSYPNLVTDGLDRAGVLAHARAVQLSSEATWIELDALLQCATDVSTDRVLEAGDSRARLNCYIDQLEIVAEVARWHPAVLQDVDFNLLTDVTAVMLASVFSGGARAMPGHAGAGDALRVLSAAWSSLPLQLQLLSSWTLDAAEGAVDGIVFDRGDGAPSAASSQVRELAEKYLRLMIDTSLDATSLLGNRAVDTFERFANAIKDVERAATIEASTSGDERNATTIGAAPEVAPMSKKNQDPLPAQPDAAAVAEILRPQLAVFEERFRRYLDDRLKTYEAARQYRAETATGTVSSTSAVAPRVSALIVVSVALLVALGGVLFGGFGTYWLLSRRLNAVERYAQGVAHDLQTVQQRLRGSGKPPTPGQAAGREPARYKLDAMPGPTWRDRLKWVMGNKPEFLQPLAQAVETSPFADAKVRTKVHDLMQGAPTLGQAERLQFRALLYEAVMAEYASPGKFAIDGDPKDVTPAMLANGRRALGIETDASSSDDFMAEAVLRRVAR